MAQFAEGCGRIRRRGVALARRPLVWVLVALAGLAQAASAQVVPERGEEMPTPPPAEPITLARATPDLALASLPEGRVLGRGRLQLEQRGWAPPPLDCAVTPTLHPHARAAMAGRAADDRLLVLLTDAAGSTLARVAVDQLPAHALIEAGYVRSVQMWDGAVLGILEPGPLITARAGALLGPLTTRLARAYPQAHWDGVPLALLRTVYTAGPEDAAPPRAMVRAALEHAARPYSAFWSAPERLASMALLAAVAQEDGDTVRVTFDALLRRGAPAAQLEAAARVSACALKDDRLAQELLARAEALAHAPAGAAHTPAVTGPGAWRAMAEHHFAVDGDLAATRAALAAAEARMTSSTDWLARAEWAYARGIHGPERAEADLLAAEKRARSALDWVQCARAWKHLFDSTPDVRRAVGEAVARADDTGAWRLLAELYALVLEEPAAAHEALEKARQQARGVGDWLLCAKTASRLGYGEAVVDAWLTQALADAENAPQLLQVAEQRWALLRDRAGAEELLARAQQTDGFDRALVSTAERYLRFFDDEEEAESLLHLAEQHATTARDFYVLASFKWHQLGDPASARRMVQEGEVRANRPDEKAMLAQLRAQLDAVRR